MTTQLFGVVESPEKRGDLVMTMPPFKKLKHDFVPSDKDRFCHHWNGSTKQTAHGTLGFRSQCGYPAMAHQDSPEEWR